MIYSLPDPPDGRDLYALPPTIFLAVVDTVLSYVVTVRAARPRLFYGAVLESGFGAAEMVLRNPLESGRFSYIGIKSVKVRGEFVFIAKARVPVLAAIPRQLFPPHAVHRIALASRGTALNS